MAKQLTILPARKIIEIEDTETILEATLRAGIYIPSGCKSGDCTSCKGKLLSGQIEEHPNIQKSLTQSERLMGFTLFCCAKPKTDIVVECHTLQINEDIRVKTLPCRVESIEKISQEIAIITLKLPSRLPFHFLAGQYIDILLPDGKKRSFSIASPPYQEDFLQLHVRHIEGGEFSCYVFNQMKEKELLRFTGPLGGFFLRKDSDKPILLIATGTGFAPIKSILEQAFYQGIQREILFYWGGRKIDDLYLLDLPISWQKHPNFTFIPILSESPPQDAWYGREGYVHQAVLDDLTHLSGWQVYACGAPIMVKTAHATFIENGLPPEEFFSDAFLLEKDKQKNISF